MLLNGTLEKDKLLSGRWVEQIQTIINFSEQEVFTDQEMFLYIEFNVRDA